jgi:hypothetical protein
MRICPKKLLMIVGGFALLGLEILGMCGAAVAHIERKNTICLISNLFRINSVMVSGAKGTTKVLTHYDNAQ